MNKREREKFSTTVNAEMLEHLLREAYHRQLTLSSLIDEVLTDRYRPEKNRFPPIPLVAGEEPRSEWSQKDLTKCRY